MENSDTVTIIKKVKAGDKDVLANIYTQFRQEFILWLTKSFGCSQDDARDIYQYAILVFYKNAQEGKLDNLSSSVKTYLFAIGKNQVKKRIKENMRFSDKLIDIIADESDLIKIDKIAYEQKIVEMANAIKELGSSCRQLLEYTYFFKFNMEDIAIKLGYKNAGTVKNLKYKCIQRLKKLIAKNNQDLKIKDYEK